MASNLADLETSLYHPKFDPKDDTAKKLVLALNSELHAKQADKLKKIREELDREYYNSQLIEISQEKDKYLGAVSKVMERLNLHFNDPHIRAKILWNERLRNLEAFPILELSFCKREQINASLLIAELIELNFPMLTHLGLCRTKWLPFTSDNSLSPFIMRALADNTTLKHLAVDYKWLIAPNNANLLAKALRLNSAITELYLLDCLDINHPLASNTAWMQALDLLFEALHHCENIKCLVFNHCVFSQEMAQKLANFIKNNQTLNTLILESSCKHSSIAFKTITEALFDHPYITEFHTEFSMPRLLKGYVNPSFLPGFNNAEDEEFYSSSIIENDDYPLEYCKALAKLIKQNRTLRKLHLETDRNVVVSDINVFKQTELLSKALNNNKDLVELVLVNSHYFDGVKYKYLFDSLTSPFSNVQRLKYICSSKRYDMCLDNTGADYIVNSLVKSKVESFQLKVKQNSNYISYQKFIQMIIDRVNSITELSIDVPMFQGSNNLIELDLSRNTYLKTLDFGEMGRFYNFTPLLLSLKSNHALQKIVLFQPNTVDAGEMYSILYRYVYGTLKGTMDFNISLLSMVPQINYFVPFLDRNRKLMKEAIVLAQNDLIVELESIFNVTRKQPQVFLTIEYLEKDMLWQSYAREIFKKQNLLLSSTLLEQQYKENSESTSILSEPVINSPTSIKKTEYERSITRVHPENPGRTLFFTRTLQNPHLFTDPMMPFTVTHTFNSVSQVHHQDLYSIPRPTENPNTNVDNLPELESTKNGCCAIM